MRKSIRAFMMLEKILTRMEWITLKRKCVVEHSLDLTSMKKLQTAELYATPAQFNQSAWICWKLELVFGILFFPPVFFSRLISSVTS